MWSFCWQCSKETLPHMNPFQIRINLCVRIKYYPHERKIYKHDNKTTTANYTERDEDSGGKRQPTTERESKRRDRINEKLHVYVRAVY